MILQADEEAAINKGISRGSGSGHTPKKVGLAKSRLLGRLLGMETSDEDDNTIRDLAYLQRKGGPPREEMGPPLH